MKLSYIGLLIIFASVGILSYAGFTGANTNPLMVSCMIGMVIGLIIYIVFSRVFENE